MKLAGELCTVGLLTAQDVGPIGNVNGFQVKTADGRVLTVLGVTQQEAIAASAFFCDRVALQLMPEVVTNG